MGNRLSTGPPKVSEVDVLAELPDVVHREALGGGRCIKSFLCTRAGSPVVAKVFVKSGAADEDAELFGALAALDATNRTLASLPPSRVLRLVPPLEVVLTDSAVVQVRQYAFSTVYDRLSTRPFLSGVEKLWLAFQMLAAVADAHEAGLTHGDIKLENFLVTSWFAVALADFALYKPTHLPADSPALYSLLFDTDGQRRGYIAPERFMGAPGQAGQQHRAGAPSLLLDAAPPGADGLSPASDVFSLGCAIVELLLDGQVWMDLSRLLAYCKSSDSASSLLAPLHLPPGPVTSMLTAMLSRDPTSRPSAADCLRIYGPEVFPAAFGAAVSPLVTATVAAAGDHRVELVRQGLVGSLEAIVNEGGSEARDDPVLTRLCREARVATRAGRAVRVRVTESDVCVGDHGGRVTTRKDGAKRGADREGQVAEQPLAERMERVARGMAECGVAARAVAVMAAAVAAGRAVVDEGVVGGSSDDGRGIGSGPEGVGQERGGAGAGPSGDGPMVSGDVSGGQADAEQPDRGDAGGGNGASDGHVAPQSSSQAEGTSARAVPVTSAMDCVSLLVPLLCACVQGAETAPGALSALRMLRCVTRALACTGTLTRGPTGDWALPHLLWGLRSRHAPVRALSARGIAEIVLLVPDARSEAETRVLASYVLPAVSVLSEDPSPGAVAEYASLLLAVAGRIGGEGLGEGGTDRAEGGAGSAMGGATGRQQLGSLVRSELRRLLSSRRPQAAHARAAVAPVALWGGSDAIAVWEDGEGLAEIAGRPSRAGSAREGQQVDGSHDSVRAKTSREGEEFLAAMFQILAEGDPGSTAVMLRACRGAIEGARDVAHEDKGQDGGGGDAEEGKGAFEGHRVSGRVGARVQFLALECLRQAQESEAEAEGESVGRGARAGSGEWAGVAGEALRVLASVAGCGGMADAVRARAVPLALSALHHRLAWVRLGASEALAAVAGAMSDAEAFALLLPAVCGALPALDPNLGLAGLRDARVLFSASRPAPGTDRDAGRHTSSFHATRPTPWAQAVLSAPVLEVQVEPPPLFRARQAQPPSPVNSESAPAPTDVGWAVLAAMAGTGDHAASLHSRHRAALRALLAQPATRAPLTTGAGSGTLTNTLTGTGGAVVANPDAYAPSKAAKGALDVPMEVFTGLLLDVARVVESGHGTAQEDHQRIRDRLRMGLGPRAAGSPSTARGGGSKPADDAAAARRGVASAIAAPLGSSVAAVGHADWATQDRSSASPWRPNGVLVAHLHHHARPIRDVAVSPSRHLIATAAADGDGAVWDCRRAQADLEPRALARLAPAASPDGHVPLCSAAFVTESVIAVGAADGAVRWHDLDRAPAADDRPPAGQPHNATAQGTPTVAHTVALTPTSPATRAAPSALRLEPLGSSGCLLALSSDNGVHILDPRAWSPGPAWSSRQSAHYGRLTHLAADPSRAPSWALTGSSSGVVSVWDLRMGAPAAQWRHPGDVPVESLALDPLSQAPTRGSRAAGSAGPAAWVGTRGGEVSLWDLATGVPALVLRTSLGVSSPSPATTAPLSLLLPDDVDPNDPARRAADTPRTATARLVHCGSVPGSAAAGGPSGAAPQGDGSGAGSDVPSAVLALPGGEVLVGGSDRAVHVFVPHDPGASYLMCAPYHDLIYPISGDADDAQSGSQLSGPSAGLGAGAATRSAPAAPAPDPGHTRGAALDPLIARAREVAVLAGRDPGEALQRVVAVQYRTSVVDGVPVLDEAVHVDRALAAGLREAEAQSKQPPVRRWDALVRRTDHQCHRDAIAGMDWALGASDRLLVTYGRDGVVKLWR